MNIVIKLPNEINEKVLMFPFLTVVEELLQEIAHEDPEDDTYQIHLISTKDGIDVLNLLPINAFYHEIDQEDTKTIFTMHRACKQLNITNKMDMFVTTTSGFIDSSIGKNLGIKNSVGFDYGKNKWVLKNIARYSPKAHFSDRVTPLLNLIKNKKSELPNVSARRLEPIYIDWNENPYYVVDLDLIEEDIINPEWVEFFDLMVNKRFVLMCSGLKKHLQEDLIKEFASKLPGKNTYKFFKFDSHIEFGKLVSYSLGLATQSKDLMSVASYCGSYVHFLNTGVKFSPISPKYFRGEVKDISYKPAEMNHVFDAIISLVEAKTAPPKPEEEPSETES